MRYSTLKYKINVAGFFFVHWFVVAFKCFVFSINQYNKLNHRINK